MEEKLQYVSEVYEEVFALWPDAEVYLLSHDRRQWENHWSDSSFSQFAYHCGLLKGYHVHLLPIDITHAELLEVLPRMDLIISGRMHLSVAAIRSRVLPVVYTGASKDGRYNMSDKVRGMLQSRLGHPELKVSSIEELRDVLRQIKNRGFAAYQDGWAKEAEREQEDLVHYARIREQMHLPSECAINDSLIIDTLLELGRKAGNEQREIAIREREMQERIDELEAALEIQMNMSLKKRIANKLFPHGTKRRIVIKAAARLAKRFR